MKLNDHEWGLMKVTVRRKLLHSRTLKIGKCGKKYIIDEVPATLSDFRVDDLIAITNEIQLNPLKKEYYFNFGYGRFFVNLYDPGEPPQADVDFELSQQMDSEAIRITNRKYRILRSGNGSSVRPIRKT